MKAVARSVVRIALLGLPLAVLTGCGGGSDSGGGGGGVTYTVGGTVTELTGSGLVLQNNGGDDLAIAASGSFTFATKVAAGAAYYVRVSKQPTGRIPPETCAVTNGSGTVGSSNVTNVAVTCTNTHSVGGTVTGFGGSQLSLSDLTLQSNLGGIHAFTDGRPSFEFGGFMLGAAYAVTVKTQPSIAGWTCVVINGTGVMGIADVTNISVVCAFPTGRFAYAANAGDNTISAYSIQSSGALIPIGTPVATGTSPYAIVGSPDRKHLYVVNEVSNNISTYAVDAMSGALAEIADSPFPAGTDPQALAIDPTGAYLYVANNGSNTLSAYAVDASTGILTPLSTATYVTGTGPSAVSVHPSGMFVFVANKGGSDDISVFTITPGTGALTPVAGSPFGAGGSPYSLAVGSCLGGCSNTFIYTANFNGATSSISGFSVNSSTGALTALSGSPFALAASNYIGMYSGYGNTLFVTTGVGVVGHFVGLNGLLSTFPGYSAAAGMNAYSVAFDQSNSVLYVANDGAASISAYTIDDVGATLTEVPGSPFAAGNMPDFIAIL